MALPSASLARDPIVSDAEAPRWGAIGRVNIGGFRSRQICTGALIAPDKVLTAAHCVSRENGAKQVPRDQVFFVAGWHKGGHQGSSRIAEIRLHPDYNGLNSNRNQRAFYAADLAVLVLEDALDIPPLPVRDDYLPEGEMRLLGYRQTRQHALTDHQGCDIEAPDSTTFFLSCGVQQGTSGAPVIHEGATGPEIIGVTTARVGGDNTAPRAFAARVRAEVLARITPP